MSLEALEVMLKSVMGYATPLILAALGGMYTAKVAVLNF